MYLPASKTLHTGPYKWKVYRYFILSYLTVGTVCRWCLWWWESLECRACSSLTSSPLSWWVRLPPSWQDLRVSKNQTRALSANVVNKNPDPCPNLILSEILKDIKIWMRSSRVWMRSSSGCDPSEWLERLTANSEVATVLGSIHASSDTVECEVRQMNHCWIKYWTKKIPKSSPVYKIRI
jgi:hypothetical protein